MEIHGEFNIREKIQITLKKVGFDYIEIGETLFAYKPN
jgi:hypothetical protein